MIVFLISFFPNYELSHTMNTNVLVYTCEGKENTALNVKKIVQRMKLYISFCLQRQVYFSFKKRKGTDLLISNSVQKIVITNLLILVDNSK